MEYDDALHHTVQEGQGKRGIETLHVGKWISIEFFGVAERIVHLMRRIHRVQRFRFGLSW